MSQEMQLGSMLKLQAGLGKNYLKDKRILILNANAIGILRKDLIYTLGKEKAKGFLIRFGFNNGFRDVENLMSDFPRIDKEGRYHLARNFHTFIGMANVISAEKKSNDIEHTWMCEGSWYDSYEAEHHIKHFGSATEPVCWTLVGYASGIMSAFFGERVIIKEVSCAAMGDQHCRYVGMKLSDWGEEIRPELKYYHGTTLGQGVDWPQTSAMEQNEALRQSVAVHEQLTRMVLNGDDITMITSAVGKIMNGTVLVEDQSFQPVAYFSPTVTMEANCQPPFSTGDIIGDWRLRHLVTKLRQENKPVTLPSELTKRPITQFVFPVISRMEVIGYVSLIKPEKKLTEHEQMTMDFIVTVFALKMTQDRTVAKTESRLLGDFVLELVSGKFRSETSIVERARCLGYNIKRSHRVLVASVDEPACSLGKSIQARGLTPHVREQICGIINTALNIYNRTGTATISGDNIIIITALEDRASSNTVELARRMQKMVAKHLPSLTISIGLGRVCFTPRDFSDSYQEAKWALKVIKSLNQKNMTVPFDCLGTFGLLFNTNNQSSLVDFMHDQLGELLEYDSKNGSELVETLNNYFNSNCIMREAAKATMITLSGFKYRLGKICEVGGFSLKDPNKKFDLQLALKIWCLSRGDLETEGMQSNEASCTQKKFYVSGGKPWKNTLSW
ncbi:MAG: hypothetical protein GX325_06100 [Peptococcaceae bacterium]|nr:hypothetical protein [Peptococcaceae bacterium]